MNKLRFRLLLLTALVLVPALAFFGWNYFGGKQEAPESVVSVFLDQMENSKAKAAVDCFGTAGCKCAPMGGWASYLRYDSTQEPNLAWLLGQNFSVSEIKLGKETKDEQKEWIVHRLAQVRLSFPKESRPFFLPLDMAYGAEISESELEAYSQNPAHEAGKGLTMRLRKSLDKGSIVAPPELDLPGQSKNNEPTEISKNLTPDVMKDLFGDQMAKFLAPKDAGTVSKADGTKMSQQEIEALLPRMTEVNLNVHLVKSYKSPGWKILQVNLQDPTLSLASGRQLALKENTDLSRKIAASSGAVAH